MLHITVIYGSYMHISDNLKQEHHNKVSIAKYVELNIPVYQCEREKKKKEVENAPSSHRQLLKISSNRRCKHTYFKNSKWKW